jgi:hypothetical protein
MARKKKQSGQKPKRRTKANSSGCKEVSTSQVPVDFSRNPAMRITRTVAPMDYHRFCAAMHHLGEIQRLLKVPLFSMIGAQTTVWRNKDAADLQKLLKDRIDVPGADGDPRKCTAVISFPLDAALTSLREFHSQLETKREKLSTSKRKGGVKRGQDVSTSIGRKYERIRAAAKKLKREGKRPTVIYKELASQFKVDERHIQRVLSPKTLNIDPYWFDDYEALGLGPEDFPPFDGK